MNASVLTAAVAFAWSWANPGEGQRPGPPTGLVARAKNEKATYHSLEPVWVQIEVVNGTDEPWSVHRDIKAHPYTHIRANISHKDKSVPETAYKMYALRQRYILSKDTFFQDVIELDDPRLSLDNLRETIKPGGTYSVRMLANLAYDMTEPGRYTMRFGVPYFSAKEGELDGGIVWTEPLVVEVTGPPESPGDR